jgi:pyruvate,orthophosphate dikinase
MFFGEERVPYVQKMILAETTEEREEALEKLLPFQREDFIGIFKAMQGRPVVIRLIDPPLHEFLPRYETLLEEVITLRLTNPDSPELEEKERLLRRVSQLRELNPMLGLRGCRLGILYPEIVKMQVRAIFEAAAYLAKQGFPVHPEVMIPLVGHVNELKYLRPILEEVVKEVLEKEGVDIEYHFGTMIEIPRAALTSSEIAKVADFYSFGTNDLTQTVFGFSRDDAEGKFIAPYLDKGILPNNPFEVLDRDGVGRLMKMCVDEARKANPNIVIGICGEHGGEPESVKLCHEIGLDYVSCSPLRVPIARLAAAQANLKAEVFEDK